MVILHSKNFKDRRFAGNVLMENSENNASTDANVFGNPITTHIPELTKAQYNKLMDYLN